MRNENQPGKQTNNHKDVDVMTVDRLRKHWFGPGRVPFWTIQHGVIQGVIQQRFSTEPFSGEYH